MSTSWGGLSADWRPPEWFEDSGSSSSSRTEPERAVDAGAWPEEIDVQFFAETAVTLPGKGDRGANCGEWYPSEFCDECGEVHFGESRCEQRSCPRCWGAWSKRRAEKITRRLGAARYSAEEPLEKRAIHAVVSPPEGEVRTLTDVHRAFRDAYGLAVEKGVRGGVAIFHGFRVTDEAKTVYDADVAAGKWEPETDGRLWSWVRSHEWDWRDLTYWSPHFHILGLATDFEADDPDEQDGWVARRIRSLTPFKLHDSEGYEDMVGAGRYLLSHATFESDTSKDCVRWFGDLATAKFSPESELSEGSLSVIERKAREAAQSGPERGDVADPEEEPETCENCGSASFSPIWEAGAALMDPTWCERIGREQERRLRTAFEWAIGEIQPPPGLKSNRTETEAREAFQVLIDGV